MSINRVILTGNLGADPEVRSTQSGTTVLTMRIAVNDRRKNQRTGEWEDYCNWIGVTMFGKRAEALSSMLRKGSKVGVEGKLRWSQWEDKSGGKRSKIEVMADEVELLTPKGGNQRAYDDRTQDIRQQQAEYVEATYLDDDIPW